MQAIHGEGPIGAWPIVSNSAQDAVKVLLVEDSPGVEKFIRSTLARRLGARVRIESKSSLSQAFDAL